MIPINKLEIAVIGDEDLVNGMRLAGVNRYFVIENENSSGEMVRQCLSKLLGEPAIGIIAMQEEYMIHIGNLLTKLKQGKKMTPVIVEVPSKFGTKHHNIADYYKSYIKGYIGFDIEI